MQSRRRWIKAVIFLTISIMSTANLCAESFLWKVTGESGTLFLQGSIHMLRAESYPLAPAIEEAYATSDTLVLEVDMRQMKDAGLQQEILKRSMLPVGESLYQHLDRNTYTQLSNACIRAGIPIETLAGSKPWFAAMTVTLQRLSSMGYNNQSGLDTYFFNKALTDQKKIIGLESVRFQINLLDSLSNENPNDFIARSLSDLLLLEEEFHLLETAWKQGDLDTLGAMISKSFDGYPALYQKFVLDRNKEWINSLRQMLRSGKTHMVVVGAGHIAGAGGLLDLLKKEGYVVEQL